MSSCMCPVGALLLRAAGTIPSITDRHRSAREQPCLLRYSPYRLSWYNPSLSPIMEATRPLQYTMFDNMPNDPINTNGTIQMGQHPAWRHAHRSAHQACGARVAHSDAGDIHCNPTTAFGTGARTGASGTRPHKHMRPTTHVRVHTQSTCTSVALFRATATAVTSCDASGLFTEIGPSTGVMGSSSSAPLEEIAVAALPAVDSTADVVRWRRTVGGQAAHAGGVQQASGRRAGVQPRPHHSRPLWVAVWVWGPSDARAARGAA